MADQFKQNGGFCGACDANRSETIHPDGTEICFACLKKIQERILHEQRN